MIREDQTTQIRDLLAAYTKILVVLTPKATADQAASASALTLSLQAAGKETTLVSPLLQPEHASLPGFDQLQTQLGNQDLTVSFPYQPEKVDKVSYHIDENSQKFYLVIKPQKGQKPLDPATVEYSFTGADAEIIFLIGVHDFESLDQLYFGYETLYESIPVITFHTFEPGIGSIKLDASGSSSQSEVMAGLLFGIDMPPTSEAASTLLMGIEQVTDTFKSLATTAETFEMVAYLLRQGARRQPRSNNTLQANPVVAKPNSTSFAQTLKTASGPNQSNQKNQSQPSKKQKNKAGTLHHQPSGFSPSGGG